MVFDKYNYSLLGLVQLGRRRPSAHQHQPLPGWSRGSGGSEELLVRHLPFPLAVQAFRCCFGGWTIICMIQWACGSALLNNSCIRLFCKIPLFSHSPPGRGNTAPHALMHQWLLLLSFTEQTHLDQVWNWTVLLLLQVVHLNKQITRHALQNLCYQLTGAGAGGDCGLPKTSACWGQSTQQFAFANGALQVHMLGVCATAQWKQYFIF